MRLPNATLRRQMKLSIAVEWLKSAVATPCACGCDKLNARERVAMTALINGLRELLHEDMARNQRPAK